MSDAIVDTVRAKVRQCLKQFAFGLSDPLIEDEIKQELNTILLSYRVLSHLFDVATQRHASNRIKVVVRIIHPLLSAKQPVIVKIVDFVHGAP